MKLLVSFFLILECSILSLAQSDTIHSDYMGTYRFINNSIVFDNGSDTHAQIAGVIEVGKYRSGVIPYLDTLGSIQILSTISLRCINPSIDNPSIEGYYELKELDWYVFNGVGFLFGVNPCGEELYVDTLGEINRIQASYHTYEGSCFYLFNLAKNLFYNCEYEKANLIFSKIDSLKSPNYQLVDLFINFNNTTDSLYILDFKKRGKYKITATIHAPSHNHAIWFVNKHLLTNDRHGDSLNNPNYNPHKYSDVYNRLKLESLTDGHFKIEINHRPIKNKRRMIGENGKKNKTRSFYSTQYYKRQGHENRESNFIFLTNN